MSQEPQPDNVRSLAPGRRTGSSRRALRRFRRAAAAQRGIAFALRTLDLGVVVDELRRPHRFATRCQARAARATGEERTAWALLATAEPQAIRRWLELTGVLRQPAGAAPPRVAPRRPRRAGFATVEEGASDGGARASANTPLALDEAA